MTAHAPSESRGSCTGPTGMTRRATFAAAASALTSVALAGCSDTKHVSPAGSSVLRRELTVRSPSMDPTIHENQVITIAEVAPGAYKPRRQDIVAVHPTAQYHGMKPSSLMIRRVIGVPGDAVSCYGGQLTLNGAALNEPYLHKGDDPSVITFDVTVPAGCLWLLGDHRAIAIDCRYFVSGPNHGAIAIANVMGVYLPNAVQVY